MQETMSERKSFVNIPATVSEEAAAFLRTLTDPASGPATPDPANIAAWTAMQQAAEQSALPQSEALVKRFAPNVQETSLNGVPVLDIRPRGWTETSHVTVYTHGGAHTLYSARSLLGRAAMFADDTSLRVISVDYTLAPHSKYDRTTDQVVAVFKALLESGHQMGDILAYGDSSGGGLMASSILKARDKKMGLPRAAVLVSPWLDVTPVGDTEVTLKAADANALYERQGKNAAAAYADPEHQRDPYASPVYGNFSTGFPPTLIQGGTKETLLSGFIRMYQALDEAGIPVKLDIYEGMPHNFQSRIPDAPESIVARKKQAAFVREHFS